MIVAVAALWMEISVDISTLHDPNTSRLLPIENISKTQQVELTLSSFHISVLEMLKNMIQHDACSQYTTLSVLLVDTAG